MFVRPVLTSSIGQAARASARSRAPVLRQYATQASGPAAGGAGKPKDSNWPMIASVAGLAGLGWWYSLGGFNDPKAVKAKAEAQVHDAADKAKHAVDSAKDKANSAVDQAKDKAHEASDKVKGKAAEAKDKASNLADQAKGKASEAKDKASEAADAAKGKAYEAKDKASEKAEQAKGKASDAADKAKGGAAAFGAAATGGALNKDEFVEFTLKQVKPYSHDTSTFVFELPDNKTPGMGVASAVVFKAMSGDGVKDDKGKDVIRPYTPITSPDVAGHMDFLIKKYPDGKMTGYVHSMKVGDKLGIKGPIPKFPYKANEFESIGMIAGGSGITPMYQVMQAIADNPSDKTQVTLIYTNKTDKDILLREEFDKLAKSDKRFKVVYGLDKLPKGFAGFEGYVTPEIAGKELPKPELADKVKIFVCGPPGQVEAVSGGKGPKGSQGELKGLLAKMGYTAEQVYKF